MSPEAYHSPAEQHNLGALVERLLSSPDPSNHLNDIRGIRSSAECYSTITSDDQAWNQCMIFLEQGESEELLRTSLVVHAAGSIASADALLEATSGRQRFYLSARAGQAHARSAGRPMRRHRSIMARSELAPHKLPFASKYDGRPIALIFICTPYGR